MMTTWCYTRMGVLVAAALASLVWLTKAKADEPCPTVTEWHGRLAGLPLAEMPADLANSFMGHLTGNWRFRPVSGALLVRMGDQVAVGLIRDGRICAFAAMSKDVFIKTMDRAAEGI